MKISNTLSAVWVITAVCLLAGCSKSRSPIDAKGFAKGSGGPVTLKVKWIVGKRYYQELSLTQSGHFEVPGSNKSMTQETIMKQDFNMDVVKALPDGGVELTLTFLSHQMSSSLNGETNMDFDSHKDPSNDSQNAAAPILRKIIGSHFTYDLDAEGKVQRILGLDEFYDQIGGTNSRVKATVKTMMNEDMLKQMAMRGLGLPDKSVKVGEQWPFKLDISAGMVGTLELNLKYTFTGWDMHDGKKCALLDYTGTMASSSAKASPVSMEDGQINGKSWFDPAVGMIVDTTSTQTMKLNSQLKGKTFTSHMTQVVSTKVLEITDLPK